jgi:hypothetical protein
VEVLGRRSPVASELLKAIESEQLSATQRSSLCEIVGAEFAERGLDSDSEPTNYGLRLERLLDLINRPNIQS